MEVPIQHSANEAHFREERIPHVCNANNRSKINQPAALNSRQCSQQHEQASSKQAKAALLQGTVGFVKKQIFERLVFPAHTEHHRNCNPATFKVFFARKDTKDLQIYAKARVCATTIERLGCASGPLLCAVPFGHYACG